MQLDYRPLTDPVPDSIVDSYRADHEIADRQSPFDARHLLFGPHPWLRRLRLDTFARTNGLTYAPCVDPTPFEEAEFYEKRQIFARRAVDVLATPDGQVTVGSFEGPGTRAVALTKFAVIQLGTKAGYFQLSPRMMTNKNGIDELDRHFTFSGHGWKAEKMDGDALKPFLMPEIAARLPPEDRQRLPPEVRAVVEQEAQQGWWARHRARSKRRKQATDLMAETRRELPAKLFDPPLQQLIVSEALGFTLELHASRLYVYQRFYSGEDELIKPELLQQMFRIAALIGPPMSEAIGKQR